MFVVTATEQTLGWRAMHRTISTRLIHYVTLTALLFGFGVSPAQAQSQTWAPVVITPPIVDTIDENFVSVISGKLAFTLPAARLGDVSFTPISTNNTFARPATYYGLMDTNYGSIAICMPSPPSQSYAGTTDCSVPSTAGPGLQAIYGRERATFTLANGQYSSYPQDGSTFVDNGSTCTWTKRDGTQVVYVAYHVSGDSRCYSNNISQIIHPDGRIATYYYYGAFSNQLFQGSPILSIATNSGYLLKYNYSGTPTLGGETSVVAINRAFETCDPSATACTLTAAWPTATVSRQDKILAVSDGFWANTANYNPYRHSTLTIEDATHKKHVFELDSYDRVISYQPPQATSPVYFYTICTMLSDGASLINCFGYTTWDQTLKYWQPQGMLLGIVRSATRNGQTWTYGYAITPDTSYQGPSIWSHTVTNPLGRRMQAQGNATPGLEHSFGPVDSISHYDGTIENYERSVRNYIAKQQTPAGITRIYGYSPDRGNLLQIQTNPISGSGESTISQSAIYPSTCANIITCNKPTSVQDANTNTSYFTYDPAHGGVLTVTGPAVNTAIDSTVNSVHPQIRSTYVQRYAWYRSNSGVMTRETRPIWVKTSESYCRSSEPASPGPGCSATNDEVVTSLDYGPDSGPNNLMLRGSTSSSGGQTLRTCYGHDPRGNTIWKASPNANRTGCPDY